MEDKSVSIFDFVNLNLPTENLLKVGGGASATQFSSDRFCDAAGENCFEFDAENSTWNFTNLQADSAEFANLKFTTGTEIAGKALVAADASGNVKWGESSPWQRDDSGGIFYGGGVGTGLTQLGSLSVANAVDVFVAGNNAFVLGGNALRVIDISTPANPQQVAIHDSDFVTNANSKVFVEGNYVYVTHLGIGGSGSALSIFEWDGTTLTSSALEIEYDGEVIKVSDFADKSNIALTDISCGVGNYSFRVLDYPAPNTLVPYCNAIQGTTLHNSDFDDNSKIIFDQTKELVYVLPSNSE